MKASITTILLLLFVHLHYARAVNWAECGDSAYCQQWPPSKACDAVEDQLQPLMEPASGPKCDIGVHIKPESVKKLTISIMLKGKKIKPTETIEWNTDQNNKKKNVFTCSPDAAKLVYVGHELTVSKQSAPSDVHCVFTVESDNNVIEIMDALHDGVKTVLYSTAKNIYMPIAYKQALNDKILCKREDLFDPDACDKEREDCAGVKNEKNWECQDGFFPRLQNGGIGHFVSSTIKCTHGAFTYSTDNGSGEFDDQVVDRGSKAKCARRKCAQCQPKANFTTLFNKTESNFDCSTLECPSGQYMLIHSKNGRFFGPIKDDEPVMCSDKTIVKPGVAGLSTPEKSRWNVNGVDEVDIETVECLKTIQCDQINRMGTDCGSSENCVPAEYNTAAQVHECNNGTAHIFLNKTDIPINKPVCTEGKWIIIAENSTEPLAFKSGDQITIKCIYEPLIELKSSSSPAESSFPIWIVFVIVFIVLLTIGIVIATYFYRKGRAAKKASMVSKTSKTSKTPSSSNPSANAPTSSGEKEPLTSAIGNSITGDSLHTAIPAKPNVVLGKADLRASTAAVSSETSTNKEKKKKRDLKESIPDLDDPDEKKREKTCASDETSKKWKKSDMTSTKEKLAPMPGSTDDALKSQTGGDGESQVSTKKNQESTKLLPKNRATPRKYSKSSIKGTSKKSSNKEFLNVTDSEEDEPSKTGSKRKGKKRK